MKVFIYGLLLILGAFLAFTFLGGSAIWYLNGADALDIEGRAKPHGYATTTPADSWRAYGGDAGGHRYSPVDQINRENVGQLQQAWHFQTGDLEKRPESALYRSSGETTPILVAGSLVFCSAFNEVIALDPGTGETKWRFDPGIDLEQRPANQFICRGVSYWEDESAEGRCTQRIISTTSDGTVLALDALDGTVCQDFGVGGVVTIDPGMELQWPGEFQVTSPAAIIGDVAVVGSSISDNLRVKAPHGTVRAYDVRSGEQVWWFDPIPRRQTDANSDNWEGGFPPVEGHANAWAPISADPERGLVFVPTSSPSPDFYGGLRPGDNRYANSVVALKADSGEVAWAYQMVHHDVWDFDTPAQPGLYTIYQDGEARDVVAQVTKMGFVFVLERDTGEPVFEVKEVPVPQGGVAGERLSPTQPIPTKPAALIPQTTSPDDAFGITWFDRQACKKAIAALRSDGLYTPPTEQGTLFRPFTGGGGNWGGSAYDPARNLLVVNMTNMAHLIQLIPAERVKEMREIHHNSEIGPQRGAPYAVRREMLVSPLDLPCTAPPWGIVAGVDLASGEIVWRHTHGTVEDMAEGIPLKLGTPTLGGPAVTAGELVFIGASFDFYLRALDVETGEELWKGRLPAAGIATPMTYSWQGRQYVVISAGSYSGLGFDPADSIVAFALP